MSISQTEVQPEFDDGKAVDYDVFSGNHGLEPDTELRDFLWVMHDEPHASRRKEMIKKYPKLKDIMGYEPMTKYIVVFLMVIQISISLTMTEEDIVFPCSLKFWSLAYIFGATISQALFLAEHEISHNLAFKKFSHNKMFGIFTNMPLLVPFFIYFKYYHNEHHKYQGVDGVDTDIPTYLEAKLLSNFLGKLFFLTFQIAFYAIRPPLVKKPIITKWHVVNYIVQGIFIGTMYYLFGKPPLYYLVASIWFAGSLHPVASHFIAEHYVFKGEDETFSYYGKLNWLTFNVGYHNEHHDFPMVPWSRLPALYEIGFEEYYGKLPYHKSWVMVLIRFLFDNKVTLFNRVKRPDMNKVRRKKNISGNAEYTGSWLFGKGRSLKSKLKDT
eukprot:snap_masked-scaffold_10-processed-gene-10.17-mRNA-1 protein AED:0.01 eAED:0.03 QI:0/-1/0/1/-1/1/1/0/383